MSKAKEKRKLKLKSILLMCFMIYALYSIANQQLLIQKIAKDKEAKQEQINKVLLENEKLKQMIKVSNSDEYIEKLAREQLGLVKPGEKVYIDMNMKDNAN